MCGWAQGCHTADVDALLFGAVTVYRTLSLHTANAKQTQMARCKQAAVQRALHLRSGGTQVRAALRLAPHCHMHRALLCEDLD